MQPTLPLDPEPDLVPEPVTGWRIWRLHRTPGGGLVLRSPMQTLEWPPREAVRARCGIHPGPSGRGTHRPPGETCGCGIYAAATLERLRVAGLPLGGGTCGALGTVSMWGRVVEHAAGYRAELAYPSRIRLVCPSCVAGARLGVPERIVRLGDVLIPSCERHAAAAGGELAGVTPAELQAELLSTYAVDLLPFETLRSALVRARVPEPVRTFATQARTEARALVGSWAGRFGAVVLLVVFLLIGVRGQIVTVTVPQRPSPASTSAPGAVVAPLPGTGDPVRPPLGEPVRPKPRNALFPLQFLCGRLDGDLVVLVERCRGPFALAGGAVFPPQSRRECGSDGYTRKQAFSVCWFSLFGLVDPYPHPAIWRLPGVRFDEVFRPKSARGST